MIRDAAPGAGGKAVAPRTKPRTEPRNVFPGLAPGCPCKCTPLSPAVCMTTLPPRCCVMVVMQSLGVAEHQQGQPGAKSSLCSRRGHGLGGDEGGMQWGWAAGSAAGATAADGRFRFGGWPDERFVVGAAMAMRPRSES